MPGMFKEELQGLPVESITPRMINTTKAPFYLPLYLVASSTSPLQTLCSQASLSWMEPLREAVVQQRTKDFWQKSGKQIVNRGRSQCSSGRASPAVVDILGGKFQTLE